jgi:uncharacterized coiled-coil protein SlyX
LPGNALFFNKRVRQVEQNFYELIFGRLRDALESQIVELRVFVHYLHLKLKVVVKLLEVFSNHKIFLKILLLLLQTKHVEHLSRQLDELEKTIELISEKISRRVNPKLKHKFVSFFFSPKSSRKRQTIFLCFVTLLS